MPYIKIQVTPPGVTNEQKAKLISGTTQLLKDVLNKNPETTFVIIEEIDPNNWGLGGEQVSERKRREQVKK